MSLMKTVKAGCILLVVALVLGILLQALGQFKGKSENNENQLPLNPKDFPPRVALGFSAHSINKGLPSGAELNSFDLQPDGVHFKITCSPQSTCDLIPQALIDNGFKEARLIKTNISHMVQAAEGKPLVEFDVVELDFSISRNDIDARAELLVKAPPVKVNKQVQSGQVESVAEKECGYTQADLNQCAETGEKAADKELNDLYRQQYNYLQTDDKKAQFKKAQLAWIKYRDAVCDYEVTSNGGSMYPMALSGCLQAVTMKRVLDLRDYLNCRENGCPD